VGDGSGLREGLGLGDRVCVGVGVGFSVGLAVTHGAGSHVGRTSVGVDFGVDWRVGCGAVDGAGAGPLFDGVSSGNFGSSNRYLSGSSLSADVACSMNCRQIGPWALAPYTS
jgi:hypothetical protein